ncbi:MAG: hypothetical protein MHPSP_000389, partial [Paramarteilia canceri]
MISDEDTDSNSSETIDLNFSTKRSTIRRTLTKQPPVYQWRTTDKTFYECKGFNTVLSKLESAKKYQDLLVKSIRARSKIEKIYGDSIIKWKETIEKEMKNIKTYEHEKVYLDMITSRDIYISNSSVTLSNHLNDMAATIEKKSDLLFGSAKMGNYENIQDISNKFKSQNLNELYDDVKGSLSELKPNKDYIEFTEHHGSFSYLQYPIYEDVLKKIHDSQESDSTCAEAESVKDGTIKSTGKKSSKKLTIECIGKTAEMISEKMKPDLNFDVPSVCIESNEQKKKYEQEKIQRVDSKSVSVS